MDRETKIVIIFIVLILLLGSYMIASGDFKDSNFARKNTTNMSDNDTDIVFIPSSVCPSCGADLGSGFSAILQ